jgi:hypothetical protein
MAKISVELHTVAYSLSAAARKKQIARARKMLKKKGFKVSKNPGGFSQTSARVGVAASNCDAAHLKIIDTLREAGMKNAGKFFTTTNCVRKSK